MTHGTLVITWQLQRDGEVEELGHNEVTTIGLNNTLDLAFGLGGTALSSANARIGVGDSSTAFSLGQTDLQASSNKLRKGMEATYPSRTGQTVTLRSSFGSAEANFAWREYGLFWGASGANMLSRRVQNLGTKTGGSTWLLTATVTLV